MTGRSGQFELVRCMIGLNMIIVVTGMVGVNKKSYLEKVCRIAGEHGREVLLCNVGDMMYAEAPDIPAG